MDQLKRRIDRFELLHRVGIALSAEKDRDRLVEMILIEARRLCQADGGTLYLRTDDDLRFAIMRTNSLGINMGGPSGTKVELPPIPLYDPHSGKPNRSNVVTYACLVKESVNIPDAYHAAGFDFSGTKAFDEHNGYRSKSILTIPLVNNEDRVIGALQLLNAADPETGEVIPFSAELQEIVEALASQAAIALDNQILIDGQKELLESFIKLIAAAIDAKSPYTGAHCERVPVLTEMITRAACEVAEGPFKDFSMSPKDWYELRISAWLHDCGKVTTPVHIMDKSTKLETIFDRMEIVRARFETLKREAEIRYLEAVASAEEDKGVSRAAYEREIESLENDLAFLEKANQCQHELVFTQAQLDLPTAAMAEGFDAVCLFVNDRADEQVMERLAAGGVRAIVQRSTGFNNLDLAAAKFAGEPLDHDQVVGLSIEIEMTLAHVPGLGTGLLAGQGDQGIVGGLQDVAQGLGRHGRQEPGGEGRDRPRRTRRPRAGHLQRLPGAHRNADAAWGARTQCGAQIRLQGRAARHRQRQHRLHARLSRAARNRNPDRARRRALRR